MPGSKSPKSKTGSKKKSRSPSKSSSRKTKSGDKKTTDSDEIVEKVPVGKMHGRLRAMLQTKENADVEFIVGPDDSTVSIWGHKCLLAVESPIFHNLFKESHNLELKLKDQKSESEQNERKIFYEKEIRLEEELKLRNNQEKDNSKTSKTKSKSSSPSKRSKSNRKSPNQSPKRSPKSEKSPKRSKSKSPKRSGKSSKSSSKGSKIINCQPMPMPEMAKDYVKEPNVIRVPSIHPIGFERMLRYIYYDDIVLGGVVNTIHTLISARHYLVYDLAKACLNYLENNVAHDYVFKLLRLAIDTSEVRLRELCLAQLINDTYSLLSMEEFNHVKKDIIIMLLNQDVLSVREVELYDFVMTWALHECERVGLPKCSTNQRIVLGNHNFKMIRFPTILPEEFVVHVSDKGVLTKDEVIEIMKYFITGRKGSLPYSFEARRRPCIEAEKLDNESIDYSIQTDMTFVEDNYKNENKVGSYEELYVPVDVLPKYRTHLIKTRSRTGSLPATWRLSTDDFDYIRDNILRLSYLHYDKNQIDYQKMHNAIITQHYA